MPHRLRVKAALAVVVAGLALMGLSGCVPGFLSPAAPVTETSTPLPEQVPAALRPFYSQQLVWSSCADDMKCASAKVPANWDDPTAGDAQIALVRHKATEKRIGSLLINPGGPGGSGVNMVKDSLDVAVDKKLQRHFDVVGFDPRGVQSSSSVHCYQPAQMDEYLFGISAHPRGSDDWIAENRRDTQDFGAACQTATGGLLGRVDTSSAARDIDVLRAVLGDRQLNYLGYSYGTFLGASYAQLFPGKVGRMVLDGALDPSASEFEVTKGQAVGFEGALRGYLKECLQRDCPFTGSVDDAMAQVRQLLDSVDRSPIRATDGRMLGADSLLVAITYPLYSPSSWSSLDGMFRSVQRGEADRAFTLVDGYYGRNSDGSYRDNSTEAFRAINCLDYSYSDDVSVMRARAADLEAAAPFLGKYLSFGDLSCATWPYRPNPERTALTATGSAPIMVIGTTADPATPYSWAVSLAGQLQNGVLVSYNGEGHTAYNKSNECVNTTVDDFFINGIVPAADPRC